jgi:hypothetical protein
MLGTFNVSFVIVPLGSSADASVADDCGMIWVAL